MLERHRFALLLSGGGAKAAYQVGVLKAITHLLPRNHSLPFPIICGTSAGAINATALACFASCYHLGVRKLEWVWKNFRTHHVYASDFLPVFSHLLSGQMQNLRAEQLANKPVSLLDNRPLRRLLKNTLDLSRIDRNILYGHLKAVSVTASSYSTNESISFFQGQPELMPWQRAKRRGKRAMLNVEHLMASSAIPMVFPSVKLEDQYFGDGSIHQLSPISPPIHLGAEKVLIVGTAQPKPDKRHQLQHHPSSAMVAGHLLDTIFADTLNSDLERLYRINHTLSLLPEKQRQATHLKPVECLLINPSVNFNEIAAKHYARLPRGIRSLMRIMGIRPDSESSLLSYLLFEGQYCQALIKQGYEDGLKRQEEIRGFLEI
ncbi:patatin-like phospholipase family protein [Aliiglaciecola sp. CAU 1673]|uniref:patatin-like phospholipase family protein n=1 Tax=Aliiglaciecola sp. CAU 1673 TaxID=3032595 RepID=UPI0023DB437B|nr:patatin-like phospholipase family protein [Aliiglaciecola sp. CAU 1673]MDF2179605.1 patatin-like phospholipase family protein [Aliiglaciecola sp. CAU 1673]